MLWLMRSPWTVSASRDHNKILMVLYYYHPYVSGVSVMAKRVAEGLVKQGYEVTVLTSRFDKSLPKRETINGVRVLRRPVWLKLGKGVIMPTFWLDMIRLSRRNDYVNPHLPLAESGLSSLFIPKRKLVTTYQCDLNLGNSLTDKLVTIISMSLMRLQLRRSRVVVPSSRDYLQHSRMRSFLDKATPIYPMVTADDFQPVAAKPLFTRLGITDDEVKIGFMGRIVYEKGIKYLLETIPLLQKRFKKFKIIIAGDYEKVAGGSIKDELDRYLQQYPEHIIFTGFLSDAERNQFYSGLDVFVLPSIDPLEAFGMVQIEAMLCGAPVVASDMPGVREIIRETGFGRVARTKDAPDIAKQIIEVITHAKRYQPVRAQVVATFNPAQAVTDYAKLMPRSGSV